MIQDCCKLPVMFQKFVKKTTKAKTFRSSIFHFVKRKGEGSVKKCRKERVCDSSFIFSILLVNPHDSSRNNKWVCQINRIIVDKKEGKIHFLFEVRLIRRKRLAFTSLQTRVLFKFKEFTINVVYTSYAEKTGITSM